jgi:ubiquinone/menaquinone biosynthesis C-methylase UbiE
MDKTTTDNEQAWDSLVRADVPCGRPWADLTPQKAQDWLNKDGLLGELVKKKVLCLASGGGQQSLGFALLGAEVTVVDFSTEQLEKDTTVAKEYSKNIRIVKSDMRNLEIFEDNEFDIVYQPYSINYIAETSQVFDEVSRVIKPGGVYFLMFHNPFVHGSWRDGCWGSQWQTQELWQGKGYPIWQPYVDGYPIKTNDSHWNFADMSGKEVKLPSPQEFKHTLSTVLNGLIHRGFTVLKFEEYTGEADTSEPGTWEHYISVAPPWFYLWAKKE